MKTQIDDRLILANNNFTDMKKARIKAKKIIIKDQEHFTSM